MKTGILGGTFDPIHNAHIMIAENAYRQAGLDKVIFMPTPNPPHKNVDELTPAENRLEMVQMALEKYSYFECSDFEINRTGRIYSAETLKDYKALHPDEELYFIIGSDSLYSIDSWYHPEIIFKYATVLVAKRDDVSAKSLDEKISYLQSAFKAVIKKITVDASNISSTEIRQNFYIKDMKPYLSEKVYNYIRNYNIYKSADVANHMTNAEITEVLKTVLKPSRFEHTLGVANTAKQMAEALGENPNTAYLAGLLHDCAKCISDDEKITICKNNNIPITFSEECNPSLLHAKVGALLAKDKYKVSDENILDAIRFHTTGHPDMTLLEKIIFTADYIEPGRNQAPRLELLRKQAYSDIDLTVFNILSDTLSYLKEKGLENTDEKTQAAYEYYKKLIDKRTDK